MGTFPGLRKTPRLKVEVKHPLKKGTTKLDKPLTINEGILSGPAADLPFSAKIPFSIFL